MSLMALQEFTYNIAADGNEDWPKATWDLPATSPDELRALVASMGMTMAQFKTMPAYTMALATGEPDWLSLV